MIQLCFLQILYSNLYVSYRQLSNEDLAELDDLVDNQSDYEDDDEGNAPDHERTLLAHAGHGTIDDDPINCSFFSWHTITCLAWVLMVR